MAHHVCLWPEFVYFPPSCMHKTRHFGVALLREHISSMYCPCLCPALCCMHTAHCKACACRVAHIKLHASTARVRSGSGMNTPCCRTQRKNRLEHRTVNFNVAYSASSHSWDRHISTTINHLKMYQQGVLIHTCTHCKPRFCFFHKLFEPSQDDRHIISFAPWD